jgi:ribosomal protein S18 acetylase RimI-like enzyme
MDDIREVRVGEISRLCVEASQRRQGIATALLSEVF